MNKTEMVLLKSELRNFLITNEMDISSKRKINNMLKNFMSERYYNPDNRYFPMLSVFMNDKIFKDVEDIEVNLYGLGIDYGKCKIISLLEEGILRKLFIKNEKSLYSITEEGEILYKNIIDSSEISMREIKDLMKSD